MGALDKGNCTLKTAHPPNWMDHQMHAWMTQLGQMLWILVDLDICEAIDKQ